MSALKEKYNEYFNYDVSLTPKFPKVLLLEVTNLCNHSCVFCTHCKMTRRKGFINEELAYRLLEEAYNEGSREVGFYMMGEPLLDKNLEKYIKYAKDLGYSYTFITTNGLLFNYNRMVSIIESGLDSIKFSFNGGDREHYLFAHGSDCYEEVKNNIITLSNYRKENGCNIKIYMSCILTRYTKNDGKKIIKTFSPFVDDIFINECIKTGGANAEIEDTVCIEGKAMSKSIQDGICFFPFNRVHVTYEGYLTLCCQDLENYLIIEDLNKMSLKEAWNSERFQRIRKRHIDGNLEGTLCYNCLNNANESVKPLAEEYAGYLSENSEVRRQIIQSRIEKLLDSVSNA